MALCANTDCRLNRSHLGLPCVNEQRDGHKCREGEFYTLLRDVLGEYGPWDVRTAQGDPYAVMRQRGRHGERVEVWPHKSYPYEVLVVTGRESEIVWRSATWGDLPAEVGKACEVAGARIQTRMEVD